MDFELTPLLSPLDSTVETKAVPVESGFRISPEPLVAAVPEPPKEDGSGVAELPRSYGTDMLCLMARDPHTLFAYWDVNWDAAFRDQKPTDRKVHLRVFSAAGSEHVATEIEPLETYCSVSVAHSDVVYTGEIGWYRSAGEWISIATSAAVTTPREESGAPSAVEFATIPFHLNFQRMIDLLQVPKAESGPLTARLTDLQSRVKASPSRSEFSETEREVVRAIEEGAAQSPPPTAQDRRLPLSAAWTPAKLERILGFAGSSRL